MVTRCYALVRGSSLRVTALQSNGSPDDPLINFAVSKSVARVQIDETTESGSNELVTTEESNEPRLHFIRPAQMINYTADVEFLRVDPGVLSIVAGVPLVFNDSGDVVGFDSEVRRPASAFALEVWSRLAGVDCEPGQRQWGYTVFPFLKGGYLSGFAFKNGLVSFNLRRAQARKVSRWGVGPYDLEGTHERLIATVSGNLLYKTLLTTATPPAEVNGIQQTTDVIDGGSAAVTSSDIIDGEFVDTSVWIVEGGRAS